MSYIKRKFKFECMDADILMIEVLNIYEIFLTMIKISQTQTFRFPFQFLA